MPSGISLTPEGGPFHQIFSRFLFPESEINRVTFLFLSFKLPRTGLKFLKDTSREFPVFVFFAILYYVKIDRTVNLISIIILNQTLNKFLLFNNMAGSSWLNGRLKGIQLIHIPVECVHIILYHLHWFKMFEPGSFFNLILTLIGIIFEMSDISNIPDIPDLISEM